MVAMRGSSILRGLMVTWPQKLGGRLAIDGALIIAVGGGDSSGGSVFRVWRMIPQDREGFSAVIAVMGRGALAYTPNCQPCCFYLSKETVQNRARING